jgi:L-ascorbate metabolism protein UlaG (beta-lactamase superfamily)
MEITILGHASALVETAGERILVDPVLRTTPLGSGAFGHCPPRKLRLDRMPTTTLLAITHAHIDHLDPNSLALIDRKTQVVAPNEPHTLSQLRTLGFRHVAALDAWGSFRAGHVRIVATPTDSGVEEVGYLFEGPAARFWHMADTEAGPAVGARIASDHGHCDVVAAKYQPTAQVMARYFRGLGPTFDKREVIDWLEAACATRPKLVFPYASGLAFFGRYQWLNRYVFPYRADQIAELLAERLRPDGTSRAVFPGDVIVVRAAGPLVLEQGSRFVQRAPGGHACDWEPIDKNRLRGLAAQKDRRELERRLEGVLFGPWARWLGTHLRASGAAASLLDIGVVWQLVVHAGGGHRLCYGIDFTKRPLELTQGALPHMNFAVHMSGASLLSVLRGTAGSELLYACGGSVMYERILGVRDGHFWAPAQEGMGAFERLPDPLTYYLRWYAPADGSIPRSAKMTRVQKKPRSKSDARSNRSPSVRILS